MTLQGSEPIDVADIEVSLEDIIDRDALSELCRSTQALFGIGVRVFTSDGTLLGGAAPEHEVCAYVGTLPAARIACRSIVATVRTTAADDDVVHPCFTGQAYRISPIVFDGRNVGRVVIGPFGPHGMPDLPKSFTEVDGRLDVGRAKSLLATVPRVKVHTLDRIVEHFKLALDLILFSGHKAFVTSKMHLHSVRESYRELEEKTATLEQSYTRLKELDRLKSIFLATVSHELRTPLTSIIGYSELLTGGIGGELSPEHREYAETIHRNGEHLLGLISGLLDFSKLESGTFSLHAASLQIGPVLDDVVKTMRPSADKRKVRLELEVDDTPCELAADADRLRQVFLNLMENALKFTPDGGTVRVSSRVIEQSDDDADVGAAILAPVRRAVEVRVSDTGIGIPEGERGRVFDPFYQVDSSATRKFGGTGLGLSIVRRIVEAHGGSVRVEGNVPTGAVFVVELPSAVAQRSATSQLPPPPK